MQISNVSITPEPCGNHVVITATIGGVARTEKIHLSEFDPEPEDIRERFLNRIRSFKLENGYTNNQVRNNLAGKVFHI